MKRPPWKVRRRLVIAALIFVAVVVIGLSIAGEDSALNRLIAENLIWFGTAVFSVYVLGAAWDDLNVMKTAGLRPYQEDGEPQPEAEPADVAQPQAGLP